jgi:hypothetical protein
MESEEAAAFPATSVQPPPTDTPLPSGPEYVGEEHEAIPEVASVPEKVTPTAWLYQPFWSGPRAADALTVGGVASRLMSIVALTVPLGYVTLQVREAAVVSPVTGLPSHVMLVQPGSKDHVMLTSLRYHPSHDSGAGLQWG